jgi:hypothetical protein
MNNLQYFEGITQDDAKRQLQTLYVFTQKNYQSIRCLDKGSNFLGSVQKRLCLC